MAMLWHSGLCDQALGKQSRMAAVSSHSTQMWRSDFKEEYQRKWSRSHVVMQTESNHAFLVVGTGFQWHDYIRNVGEKRKDNVQMRVYDVQGATEKFTDDAKWASSSYNQVLQIFHPNFSYAMKIFILHKSILISFSTQLPHLKTNWLKYLNTPFSSMMTNIEIPILCKLQSKCLEIIIAFVLYWLYVENFSE